MQILSCIQRRAATFLQETSGAVTVDWVVLTAAITGLGLASAAAVRTGTADLSGEIEISLSGATVASLGCMGSNSAAAGWECYTGPTIDAAVDAYGFGVGGGCWMDSEGNGGCGTPSFTMVEEYRMSDGQTYRKVTVSTGGTSTTTWQNMAGQTVEAPPPAA